MDGYEEARRRSRQNSTDVPRDLGMRCAFRDCGPWCSGHSCRCTGASCPTSGRGDPEIGHEWVSSPFVDSVECDGVAFLDDVRKADPDVVVNVCEGSELIGLKVQGTR